MTEEFIHDYKARHQDSQFEVMNIDTREGSAMATLYDVLQYPAILILQANGYVQQIWQGPELPRLDDVAAYSQG
jgi:hypothetical protein